MTKHLRGKSSGEAPPADQLPMFSNAAWAAGYNAALASRQQIKVRVGNAAAVREYDLAVDVEDAIIATAFRMADASFRQETGAMAVLKMEIL